MHITYADGIPVYEPANDMELGDWRPAQNEALEFVKISRREYWIFNCGTYVGSASRLVYADAWQAVSGENRLCVAPLSSLLECAERLMVSARRGAGCS
jgi:hypothetical protein